MEVGVGIKETGRDETMELGNEFAFCPCSKAVGAQTSVKNELSELNGMETKAVTKEEKKNTRTKRKVLI